MSKKKTKKKISKKTKAEKTKGIAQKRLKNFRLADSYVSLILGIVVVLVLAILFVFLARALHFRRQLSFHQPVEQKEKPMVRKTTLPSSPQPAQSSAITQATYTVLEGDHLWEIAVRAYGDGFRWSDIAKANNLSSPDAITVGMVLTIPR